MEIQIERSKLKSGKTSILRREGPETCFTIEDENQSLTDDEYRQRRSASGNEIEFVWVMTDLNKTR